jgi:hypothetical protein
MSSKERDARLLRAISAVYNASRRLVLVNYGIASVDYSHDCFASKCNDPAHLAIIKLNGTKDWDAYVCALSGKFHFCSRFTWCPHTFSMDGHAVCYISGRIVSQEYELEWFHNLDHAGESKYKESAPDDYGDEVAMAVDTKDKEEDEDGKPKRKKGERQIQKPELEFKPDQAEERESVHNILEKIIIGVDIDSSEKDALYVHHQELASIAFHKRTVSYVRDEGAIDPRTLKQSQTVSQNVVFTNKADFTKTLTHTADHYKMIKANVARNFKAAHANYSAAVREVLEASQGVLPRVVTNRMRDCLRALHHSLPMPIIHNHTDVTDGSMLEVSSSWPGLDLNKSVYDGKVTSQGLVDQFVAYCHETRDLENVVRLLSQNCDDQMSVVEQDASKSRAGRGNATLVREDYYWDDTLLQSSGIWEMEEFDQLILDVFEQVSESEHPAHEQETTTIPASPPKELYYTRSVDRPEDTYAAKHIVLESNPLLDSDIPEAEQPNKESIEQEKRLGQRGTNAFFWPSSFTIKSLGIYIQLQTDISFHDSWFWFAHSPSGSRKHDECIIMETLHRLIPLCALNERVYAKYITTSDPEMNYVWWICCCILAAWEGLKWSSSGLFQTARRIELCPRLAALLSTTNLCPKAKTFAPNYSILPNIFSTKSPLTRHIVHAIPLQARASYLLPSSSKKN